MFGENTSIFTLLVLLDLSYFQSLVGAFNPNILSSKIFLFEALDFSIFWNNFDFDCYNSLLTKRSIKAMSYCLWNHVSINMMLLDTWGAATSTKKKAKKKRFSRIRLIELYHTKNVVKKFKTCRLSGNNFRVLNRTEWLQESSPKVWNL